MTAPETWEDLAPTDEASAWEIEAVPRSHPDFVRRRVEFLLEAFESGNKSAMSRRTGVPRNVLNHVFNRHRQSLTTATAALIAQAYEVDLDFLYIGKLSDVSPRVIEEIQRWTAEGRWDIDAQAPAMDDPGGSGS